MPKIRRQLTPRMTDIVEAVDKLTAAKGHAPSLRELADKLGVCFARAQRLANEARDRGALTWTRGVHRSFKTTIDIRRQRPRT